jgi:hypothetical protein
LHAWIAVASSTQDRNNNGVGACLIDHSISRRLTLRATPAHSKSTTEKQQDLTTEIHATKKKRKKLFIITRPISACQRDKRVTCKAYSNPVSTAASISVVETLFVTSSPSSFRHPPFSLFQLIIKVMRTPVKQTREQDAVAIFCYARRERTVGKQKTKKRNDKHTKKDTRNVMRQRKRRKKKQE